MNNYILNEDILELEGIEAEREKWNVYSHNDNGIPRVSHIIQQCEDQSVLIKWSENLGYKCKKIRENSLNIGTYVHELIDKYLDSKYISRSIFNFDIMEYPFQYQDKIKNAFSNFQLWEKRLNEYGYFIEEVVGLEIPISCPWYGGTIDAIFKINGKYYIIDFKTSKRISMSYLLQTSAYMWIINNRYNTIPLPFIDGIGIIRVDKSKYGEIDDLFINDFTIDGHNKIIQFQNTFISYVNSYYNNISSNYIFNNYYNTIYEPRYIFSENKDIENEQ